jgi:hypothetical protein
MFAAQDIITEDLLKLKNKMVSEKNWFTEITHVRNTFPKLGLTTFEIHLKDILTELMNRYYQQGFSEAYKGTSDYRQGYMLRVAYEMGKRGEPIENIEKITNNGML